MAMANTGHYRVGSAGDFEAVGWGVSVSRSVGETTRASVDYSLADAEWTGRSRDILALAHVASQVLRRSDRVHDLTASVESVVPASSTRVFVLYKLNSAVAAGRHRAGRRLAVRASTSRSTRRCRSGLRGRGGKRWSR